MKSKRYNNDDANLKKQTLTVAQILAIQNEILHGVKPQRNK